MNLKRKIASIIAAGTVLLNATPAFAMSVTLSGNLSGSTNYADLDFDQDVNVDQNNDADVDNSVTIYTNTGANDVKDVASGDVSIDTGDTEVGVAIQNTLNSNVASVDVCGGCVFTGDFKIAQNASGTDNDIAVDVDQDIDVDQDNDADVVNDVDVAAKSGYNKVNDVTGDAEVEVTTGKVVVNPVMIKNTLNSNVAVVGGGDDEDKGTLSAWITGNLSDSDSYIDLDFDQDTDVDQDNDANVANDVDVLGDSGHNEIRDIAGALATIDTGDVEIGVLVDTMANFNTALVADCCLLDLDAGIKENASKSDNDIALDLDNDLDVDQDNDLDCDGGHGYFLLDLFGKGKGGKCSDVDITGLSGSNKVADATSSDDPAIDTGDTGVAVEVENTANANVFQSGSEGEVEIDLDFSELADMLEDLLDLLK